MIRHGCTVVMAAMVVWATGCVTPPPAPIPEPPAPAPVVEAAPVAEPPPPAPPKPVKPAKPKTKPKTKALPTEAAPAAAASTPAATASAPVADPALAPPASAIRGPAWLAGCVTRRMEGGVILCDADRLLAQPSARVRVMTRDAALAGNTAGGPITHRAGLPRRYRLFVVP